jgi:hypothetical protein
MFRIPKISSSNLDTDSAENFRSFTQPLQAYPDRVLKQATAAFVHNLSN